MKLNLILIGSLIVQLFFGCSRHMTLSESTIIKTKDVIVIYPVNSNFIQRKNLKKSLVGYDISIIDSSKIEECLHLGLDTIYKFISTPGNNVELINTNKQYKVIIENKFTTGCGLGKKFHDL